MRGLLGKGDASSQQLEQRPCHGVSTQSGRVTGAEWARAGGWGGGRGKTYRAA